jgi:hypothetical protein
LGARFTYTGALAIKELLESLKAQEEQVQQHSSRRHGVCWMMWPHGYGCEVAVHNSSFLPPALT